MKNSFYRDLFNKSDIGYAYHKIIYDKEGMPCDFILNEANDVFYRLINDTEKKIIGKKISELKSDMTELIDNLKTAVINNTVYDFQYSCKTIKEYYRVIAAMPDKGYIATLFLKPSVTDKALVEYEEQLKVILEATNEGIYGVDKEGCCTFCNTSCLRLLGYSKPEELLGLDMNKIMHHHHFGQSMTFVNDIIDRLFSNKVKQAEHEVFVRKDGTYFYAEYNCYPYYHNDEVIGAVITFIDVTSRMAVEYELKESERSRSVLLENLPGMAYRSKFDKNRSMQFVSQGCYELTGYKPESILNNKEISYGDIIKPEYRQSLWQAWKNLIGTEKKYREEYVIITASDKEKWVLEQGQLIYDNKRDIVAIEGLIIDITEQKRKQKEIEYLSYHDHLTGLYNRIYFNHMRQRLEKPENLPLSLIIGDINGLKL